jgi:hypothetical protein
MSTSAASPGDITSAPTPDDVVGVARWPAAIALLAIGVLFLFVSDQLTLGPPWLPLAFIVVLLVVLGLATRFGRHGMRRWVSLAATGIVTVAVVASTAYLVQKLLSGELPGPALLEGAAIIWAANLVTFGIWYWEIDGGGPGKRRVDGHISTDFLFPQLQVGDGTSSHGWSPGFLDYLFVAFTNSTAFSPTDTLPLTQRAKVLMMIQSLISLLTIAVLAARAINTLNAG